jgi:TIR domain-containing protein
MKVFLSWSDETSHKIASALSDWLPYVIQAVEPFVSSENIDKGERWSDELMRQLNETEYGIICITRHNIDAAWMNFEAGAISKAIGSSRVSPFLFHVRCSQFAGPLQQYQFTQYGKEEAFNKEDVFKLVSSINNRLRSPQQVPHERLRRQFETWWSELKKRLDDIANNLDVGNVAGRKWLLIPEDLAVIQDRYQFNSIWIITDNLFQYSLRSDIKEIVLKNMAKGIEYVYVIPDSNDQDDDVKEFDRICKDTEAKVRAPNFRLAKVQRIPHKKFYSSAAADYVIVNPNNNDHSPLRMFLKLPVEANDPYWIEVDFDAAEKFVARFRTLAEGKVHEKVHFLGRFRRHNQ